VVIRARRDGFEDAGSTVTIAGSMSLDFTLVRARVNLAGVLTGTFAFTVRGTSQRATWPMTATVAQTGTAISGTFRARPTTDPGDDWTGSFAGTLSTTASPAQYSGALTISGLISTGSGRCNGTRSNVTGTVATSQLTLSAPGLWNWVECTSTREDVTITLAK
jgi:hypothetical protein